MADEPRPADRRDPPAASAGADMARQGSVVAGMTLLSRISGLVRDMALAYLFGASQIADMFFVALRIPNFFRRLFAEGAFNQAFVPVMVRYRDQGHAALLAFLAPLSGIFALAVSSFVVVGVVFAEPLAFLFAPGFAGENGRLEQTGDLVRITFPYLAFISLTAYAGAVLNAHDRFAVPAVTPVLLNLCLIGAALVALGGFVELADVEVLAWGVLVAGVVQLLFQGPSMARLKLLPRPAVDTHHPGVRQVGRLLVPAVLAGSVGQINALVNTILASTLMAGSISWLYYADRLLELPVGLVAIALGTVMLPHLSRMAADGSAQQFRATLSWGVSLGLGLGLPAGVALFVLSEGLIATLFESISGGAMTDFDLRMAAYALEMFALALPAFVLVRVLSPAFYAHENTQAPFRYAAVAVAVNLVASLATFSWFGHVGLAWATALSAWANVLLLLRGLRLHGLYAPDRQLGLRLLKLVPGVLVLGAGLTLTAGRWDWLAMAPLERAGWMAVVTFLGIAGYAVVLALTGVRLQDLKHSSAVAD